MCSLHTRTFEHARPHTYHATHEASSSLWTPTRSLSLQLINVHTREMVKLASVVDSMCWHDATDMLAAIAEGRLAVWTYPYGVFVEQGCAERIRYMRDGTSVPLEGGGDGDALGGGRREGISTAVGREHVRNEGGAVAEERGVRASPHGCLRCCSDHERRHYTKASCRVLSR